MEYWFSSANLRPYKVTYLSNNSQNEYINLTGDKVRKLIAEEIVSAKLFAVVADTTPDKSHRDQISLVIRYVNKRIDIKERLVKISEIKGKTGTEFAEKVLSMLEELHVQSGGIRFQCYDTTSSMSGKYNGAQAKLSEFLGRSIPYIMCMGHKTNLCVEHSLKELRMIEVFFTTLQNLYNFLTKSTSRFDIYIEKVEELQEGLIMKNQSVTRWIGRAKSIKAV